MLRVPELITAGTILADTGRIFLAGLPVCSDSSARRSRNNHIGSKTPAGCRIFAGADRAAVVSAT